MRPGATGRPVFLKLGGALLTDKSGRESPRTDVIARVAGEIAAARGRLDAPLVVSHGSGSFAHVAVVETGFLQRPDDPLAFATVAAAARRLDALVVDALLAAGVPAVPMPGAAVVHMTASGAESRAPHLVRQILDAGSVPVVYGDVVWRVAGGGAVASTEEILVALAAELSPVRIVLATDVPGVVGGSGGILATVSAGAKPLAVSGAAPGVVDVTGGMAAKLARMAALVAQRPDLDVRIVSGLEPGLVTAHLLGDPVAPGTRIVAAS